MGTGNQVIRGGLATLADICRLWATLTTDYIPALKIELTPTSRLGEDIHILVELVDYAPYQEGSPAHRSVWSRREFYSPLYLISHTQLFDLLIVGHRVIEEYFSTGVDNRPSSLKG